jgi:hypothetical protein
LEEMMMEGTETLDRGGRCRPSRPRSKSLLNIDVFDDRGWTIWGRAKYLIEDHPHHPTHLSYMCLYCILCFFNLAIDLPVIQMMTSNRV